MQYLASHVDDMVTNCLSVKKDSADIYCPTFQSDVVEIESSEDELSDEEDTTWKKAGNKKGKGAKQRKSKVPIQFISLSS